ncbi:hypothetical protein FN846DRAFT_364496 [Sphaerosporella brunnea]|uniref:Uncharacterized protein n=1 Tax=Sphaerosporella brunnea TaxID=1250544 RepID=A0A5J5EJX9_9PEZI|nr:hypothetical protein FN846DRAFT_364496 [Sphaerosporella brunnea]
MGGRTTTTTLHQEFFFLSCPVPMSTGSTSRPLSDASRARRGRRSENHGRPGTPARSGPRPCRKRSIFATHHAAVRHSAADYWITYGETADEVGPTVIALCRALPAGGGGGWGPWYSSARSMCLAFPALLVRPAHPSIPGWVKLVSCHRSCRQIGDWATRQSARTAFFVLSFFFFFFFSVCATKFVGGCRSWHMNERAAAGWGLRGPQR